MKKHIKSIAGVTLLEIMLVLAIASLVIVMSIRYYTNATTAEDVNIILETTQNIASAMDNLSSSQGEYSTTTSALTATVGANNMKTPYGTTIVLSGNTSGTSTYTISIPMPSAGCYAVAARLHANTKFVGATCNGGTSVTYTYNWSS